MKGKRCPSCGTFNRINSIFCTGCGEDLLRVPISDGELSEEESTLPKPQTETSPETVTFQRKCPKCGKIQPYRMSRCDCGTLLLTQPPYEAPGEDTNVTTDEKIDPQRAESAYALVSEDGTYRLDLPFGADYLLGRKETGSEYLGQKSFVSGKHARIRVSEEGIMIEHIGTTNPTLINGAELKPNTPYSLSEGDRISLGARPGQEFVPEAAYLKLVREA